MIMDVQEIIQPADLGAVLDQFKTFALARGWTLDGDSSGVFQLRSSGFGNQAMIFRFKGQYTGAYAYYGIMEVIGVSPLTPAFSTSMTTGAFTATSSYVQVSIRGAGAHRAWIVGNSKVLGLIYQNNEYSCTSFMAGSFDLFDTGRSDGYFAGHSRYNNGAYTWDSTNPSEYRYFTHPWANGSMTAVNTSWFDGAGRNYNAVKPNFANTAVDTVSGAFDKLGDLLQAGSGLGYAGGRLLIRPTVYGYESGASLWRPIGKLPWCFLKSAGLSPGQTIRFGGEDYVVFPYMYIPHPYAWAVRVS